MPMMKSYKSFDEYILNFPVDARKKLKQIRAAVKAAAPKKDLDEGISYGMPAFKYLNKPLFYFAAQQKHFGIYPISPVMKKIFRTDLEKYDGFDTKGTIRLPLDKAIPVGLIKKLVKYRVKETQEMVKKKVASSYVKKSTKKKK